MIELYETQYGIYDHRHSSNPLGGVQFHPAENFIDHYLYESYLEVFLYKGVYKYTGISFDDFLDKPRYEIEKILNIVESFRKKESSVSEDALSKFKKSSS